jgi:hypothetical protein
MLMERNYLAIDSKVGGAVVALEKAITRILLGKEEEAIEPIKTNHEWGDMLMKMMVEEETIVVVSDHQHQSEGLEEQEMSY